MSASTYELKLADGRIVTMQGKDGVEAAKRYADLHGVTVVAWRAPRVGVHVGVPVGA